VEIVKDPIKTKQSVINEVYGKNHDPIWKKTVLKFNALHNKFKNDIWTRKIYNVKCINIPMCDGMTKIPKSDQSQNTSKNYKLDIRTPRYTGGRIRCLEGVSIPCWSITPAVSPVLWSWMRIYLLSKSVC
jgi:hypothetical protein